MLQNITKKAGKSVFWVFFMAIAVKKLYINIKEFLKSVRFL